MSLKFTKEMKPNLLINEVVTMERNQQ